MKLEHLFEQMIKNPLGTPPSGIGDIMNVFDQIETDFVDGLLPNMPSPQRYYQGGKEIRDHGNIETLPIASLIPLEPEVDKSHIDNINSGEQVKMSGGDLPLVYLYNGKYYINDGNHRVAAAKMRNETSTRVVVVDLAYLVKLTKLFKIGDTRRTI